jgi:hypothetical protein
MSKRITIMLDESVYEGLHRTVGKRRISQFIEELLRPHVLDGALDEGYKAMALDAAREQQAREWCEALSQDMSRETR